MVEAPYSIDQTITYTNQVCSAASSNDGRFIFSTTDELILKTDAATGVQLKSNKIHVRDPEYTDSDDDAPKKIWKLRVAPNDEFIVTCELESGALKVLHPDLELIHCLGETFDPPIFCVAVSPNCKLIASGNQDGEVKIWEHRCWSKPKIKKTFEGNGYSVLKCCLQSQRRDDRYWC